MFVFVFVCVVLYNRVAALFRFVVVVVAAAVLFVWLAFRYGSATS